ncbi:MAG: Xaa-Pro peptidase family protein [Pseudomonadota bacterium]
MSPPFPRSEYEARVAAAQSEMDRSGLAALWLTCEADICYFTGFLTRFWASPSRPWFVVLPAQGAPVAVIPEIGAWLMAQTGIQDIRTWPAPRPGDDGVSLLADALNACGGPVGTPQGPESHLHMPLSDFASLQTQMRVPIVPDGGLVAGLRAIKSAREIDAIEAACAVAGRAFDRVGEIAREGVSLAQVFRDFQGLLLQEGADWVGYLSGGAGQGGYTDVISPARETPLAFGDVLMLDTGAVLNGYYCDYDRNYSVGPPGDELRTAHARLIEAAKAALDAIRPGQRACDLWQVMARITGQEHASGRMGHGLGLQLTEGLSLMAGDASALQAGMVVTLEPVIETAQGRLLVHEEVCVVTEQGARPLTRFAGPDLPVV